MSGIQNQPVTTPNEQPKSDEKAEVKVTAGTPTPEPEKK